MVTVMGLGLGLGLGLGIGYWDWELGIKNGMVYRNRWDEFSR